MCIRDRLTADRFQGICPPENIWVVPSEKYADTVKEQLPDIDDDHILQMCIRDSPNTVSFEDGKTLKYYIEQAGGYGFRAKKSKAYICLLYTSRCV